MRPEPSRAAAIVVGEVRHTRNRPKRHAFHYPAYFLRLPMRRLDDALAGQRFVARNRFNLLSFHDVDHGERRTDVTLVAWIDGLLHRERIVDAGGDLWLHTFPRVLGYAFKPVSFWFCHRVDGALRAVVCEVNNTFGERHCYLLAHADGRPIVDGEELAATKVFHVSPFCDVAGGYRFRFAHARDRVVARIEYDAVENDLQPLITTSLSGRLAPLADRAVLSAFFRIPLFTLGVMVRIHWHALRLFIKRAPFFSKPTPPTAQVTR